MRSLILVHWARGDKVRISKECCLLTSDFDVKKVHGVKQSAFLIVIF